MPRIHLKLPRRPWEQAGLLALAALVILVAMVVAGRKNKAPAAVPTAAVERQDIVVTVEANGTIEPINVVEVKSKASGQIVSMPIEIGSQVRAGQLLAQVDPRDVRNQYNQARAALRAAQVQLQVAAAQKKRSDQLFAEKVITAQEHEAAVLEHENARSQLVRARTDLDIARQRLEDATVRAPSAGTVIEKPVAVGQVISSATSSVSGGTTLLKMADLNKIRLRALVNETDIGNVKPDQPATVVVDAYPDRSFRGAVEKVEPMAVVEQSVTLFPVLVSIANEEGLLMPGMNGEVTVLVERMEGALAVPVDAVRSPREAAVAAQALGLEPDEVRSALRARAGAAGGEEGGAGRAAAAISGGARPGGGEADTSARAASRESRRGDFAARRAAGGEGPTGARPEWSGATAGAGTGGAARGGRQGGRRAGAGMARVVFVKTGEGFAPRMIRIGVSNYDVAQVLSGLQEGDEVALLSAAQLQQNREEILQRIRQRTALPGVSGGSGGRQGGGAGGGSGGGGR